MNRSASFCVVLAALGLLAGACSDQYAPDNQAHPDTWVLTHGGTGGAAGGADDCKTCHGADLAGGTIGVACRDCHLEGPPFAIHPANWGIPVISHQQFAENRSWTGCATTACHGSDLHGGHGSGETGPSCFTSDALGCHSDGPQPPGSHRGVNFSDPAEHGPFARGVLGTNGELDPESTQFYCRNCHGLPPNDFSGGFVADPAILDADAACTECHPDAGAHPTNWTSASNDVTHAATPAAARERGCALCHDILADAAGPNPRAPSCFVSEFENADGFFTAACHGPGGPGTVPHTLAATWLLPSGTEAESHVRAFEAGDPSCLGCHELGGVSPLCVDCHTAVTDPATIVEGTCVSCHGVPPSGEARPDREGAHLGHVGLTASTLDCSACHAGAGSATLVHFDEESPADVNLASTFDANAGAATQNGDGTCVNVSCHGGETTPVWLTGDLEVAQGCESCHGPGTGAGAPEANSYYSGLHNFHVSFASALGFSPPCSACHDAVRLQEGGHFADLATPAFEGDPATTLRDELNYAAPTCTTGSADPQFAACHLGDTRSWNDD